MNRIKKAICGGMIGLAGLISGCTTTANDYGKGLVGMGIQTAVVSGVDNAIAGQLNPQQTNTNVYVNNQVPQTQVANGPDYVHYKVGNEEFIVYGEIVERGSKCLLIDTRGQRRGILYSTILDMKDN